MEEIKIFIATHKKADLPKKEGYIPIQVGAEGKQDLGYQKDNEGENISSKNPNYCELTALYWMWKNVKCDVIGLVHYRRYFFEKGHTLEDVLQVEKVEEILKEKDCILPEKTHFGKMTVKEEYAKFHEVKDLEQCMDIVKELYPDYAKEISTLLGRKSMHAYNMFVMRKDKFDSYMEWLFPILEELEKKIQMEEYTDYNKRIYGFLSERLFNIWLMHQQLKIEELPVYNTEESFAKQLVIRNVKKVLCKIEK